jgi:hypothetical protein
VQLAHHRGDDRIVAFRENPASSMPPRKQRSSVVPLGTRCENFGAHPGTRHQAAAFALGHQKAKALERFGEGAEGKPSATVIDEL